MKIDFRDVLAHSPNPYVILDPSLTIIWANNAYLGVTGRSLDEIESRGIFEAFPSEGESYRQLKSSFDRVLATAEPDEIAHIPYSIPNSEGGFDTHIWSATHTPFLDENGAVEYILQHTVQITGMEQTGSERDAASVVRRAEAVEQRYQGATKELERFRALLEQAPGFVAVLGGRNHRFVMANAAYRRLIGQREIIGQTVAEALPEVVDQGFVEILDEVLKTGEPYLGQRELVQLKSGDDGALQSLYLEFIFQPIHMQDGFRGVFVQGHDVTEEVEAEDHQRVLINELNHRVKNTLAVVQGLAQQSFRSKDTETGLDVFTERLSALASAHNLLTERNWQSADLATIVRGSLEATAGSNSNRYSLTGPPVILDPQAAVALSMVVHELCTNALKYGALSNDTGQIEIRWDAEVAAGENRLIFDWQEGGGPDVAEPKTGGFGTRLIRRGLGNPNGKTTIEYRTSGLHCRIESPV